MRDNEFIAIGEAIIDYVYEDVGNDPALVQKFFSYLCPESPPHKGETRMLTSENWVIKTLEFGIQNGILTNTESGSPKELSQKVISHIFGSPTVSAGCAAANIFDGIARAKINSKPLVKSMFVTAVGTCDSGQIFIDSIAPENLHYPQRFGMQKEAHIFEVDGDRIIIGHASANHDMTTNMSPNLLDEIAFNSKTKMVLVDGYLIFENLYKAMIDKVAEKIEAISPHYYERPTIVLSTACVEASKSPQLKYAFRKMQEICPVVVVANVEELAGLIEADESWKEVHSHKSWYNLKGADFDKASANDADYQADKLRAGNSAMEFAYDKYCSDSFKSIEFLVTNGSKPTHIISGTGISEGYPTKKPPFGVKNTVGAGDNFSSGFLLGKLLGLSDEQSIEVGSVAAAHVIGQDAARLPFKQIKYNNKTYEGLPAYLMSEREEFLEQRRHGVILENLVKSRSQSRGL